ncbi:MAG TPA: alpha/beta hydrolase [Acidimicrobiales bacterium]
MTVAVAYRGLSDADREREYTPSSRVASLQLYLHEYASRSARARVSVSHERVAYGPGADEWLWYAPGPTEGAPLHVFVHGGYWQRLSADDGTFAAPAFHDAGAAFASLNYTLCPAAPLGELARQTRAAFAFLNQHAADLGHGRIHGSGHSAGAHLLAWAAADPECGLAGATFVSGVFDLVPLLGTTINDAVGLDSEAAARLSPRPPVSCIPTVVAWGELDTTEFRRQSLAWASAWAETLGNHPPVAFEVEGTNHFDVVLGLGDPSSRLARAVLQQMELS